MAKTTGFIAFICISCICLLACASCTSENKIENKEWSVIYNEGTKTLDYNHNGKKYFVP